MNCNKSRHCYKECRDDIQDNSENILESENTRDASKLSRIVKCKYVVQGYSR